MADCCVCGPTTKELRPYGPGGRPICFSCAMAPERKTETERQFAAKLDAAGPVALIGGQDGPQPLIDDEEPHPRG